MRLTMVGAGYVGLVSAACFSEFGHEVICVDLDEQRVASLNDGHIPIFEPGLEAMVSANQGSGRLTFSTDLAGAVAQSQVVFIAVGTPSRRGDGHADLGYVYAAARDIADALQDYTVIVTKSTVPVGTGRKISEIITERRPDADFDVVSNPEFLREGAAIDDFIRPDRIVVGTDNERPVPLMRDLYSPLFLRETPFLFTTIETSELVKYATNAYLATKITFINELADLCEKLGANVSDVSRGLGMDGRIGPKFLHPGPGYGGSCFPKDTKALVQTAEQVGGGVEIVKTVISVNDARKQAMADRVIAAAGGSVSGKVVAVLGVTFKPNTDDMRDSPALDIIPALQRAGAEIRAFDPEGMDKAAELLSAVVWCDDPYEAMTGADAVAIVTEWNEFRALDLPRARNIMTAPVMIDMRNIYSPEQAQEAGFTYYSIGRPAPMPAG